MTVVILDSCFSGSFVDGKSLRVPIISKALSTTNCTVMAASSADEVTYEGTNLGIFTQGLVDGLGYYRAVADTDGDNMVTTSELFEYAKEVAIDEASDPKYPTVPTPVLTRDIIRS